MGRSPCCDKNGLKKGPWTPEEDTKLIQYIEAHGAGNWRNLPKNAGLQRCGKSCRLRWTNYLRPDIKRGRFSFEEEETIIQLHTVLGNKWSAIAERLPGRTDNEIKNYWNTHIRKRLLRMGIDPVTHAPRLDLSSLLNSPHLNLQTLQLIRLLNPDALRLAITLTSSSSSSSSSSSNAAAAAADCNLQLLQHHILGGTPPILPNHFETNIDQQIPPNTINHNSFHTQISQHHLFVPHTNATDHQSSLLPAADFCYRLLSDQTTADFSENSSFDQSMNSNSNSNSNSSHGFCSFDSVVSTPLSSPPMLNKSLIDGGGEDDSQIFNHLFRFEVPESLNFDFDDFM